MVYTRIVGCEDFGVESGMWWVSLPAGWPRGAFWCTRGFAEIQNCSDHRF